MKRFLRFCVFHPYWIIFVVLGITAFFAAQIPKMRIDSRVEIFLSEDNPARKVWNENNEEFEAPLDIVIGIIANDIYNYNYLKKIRDVTSEIEAIPGVKEVTNILNIDYITGNESGIEVSPMAGEGRVPKTTEELAAFKRKMNSWDFYKGLFVAADGKGSLLSITMEDEIETDDIIPIYYKLKTIVAEYQGTDNFFIAGVPIVEALQGDYMLTDMKLFVPLVNLVIIIALFLFFRNIRGVVLPLLTVSISTIWSVGLMCLLGMPLTHITSTIPVVLVAVGTAYGIHVLENIFSDAALGKVGKPGIINALNRVSLPVTMAGLTTMAAFISLCTSEIIPLKQFGMIVAFGILVALVISLSVIPALLSILDDKTKAYIPHHYSKKDIIAPILKTSSSLSLKNSTLIIIISLGIMGISVIGATFIKSDLDPVKHFRQGSPIRTADAILNEKFGGTSMFNVVIKGEGPDDIKDPAILRYIDGLQDKLKEIDGVGKTVSIVDLIKKMNQVMHGGDSAYYAIPKSRELVAQYLLLYSFSGGETLERFVNYDYQDTQILLQTKSQSGFLAKKVLSIIEDYKKNELKGSDINIITTGISKMTMEFNRIIIEGQISTFAVSLALVILITSLIFRSLKLGLFSILPLTVTIMLNFGIMGGFNITLNAATAMIASLAVGIGVDYSIHFLSRYRHEIGIKNDMKRAIDVSINTSGRAILYNALAVTAGFLVLIPSNFIIISQMGFLTALVMITSAIASITLLPAVLKVFHPSIKQEPTIEYAEGDEIKNNIGGKTK
ncbi:MAG: MMPL family transporter [Thermodesulfobacteriota bacterium]|nr:MMPL family transporter [Thermodesulfobacteriota bacterium]